MSISSQIRGNLGLLYQQGIDAYGIQREVVIARTTNLPVPGSKHYTFNYVLTIYMHPGIRQEVVIARNWKSRGKEPADAMKLALRLDKLAKGPERYWFLFHNFAMHSESLKGIIYLLKRLGA
jgi:hypothetical protein